MIFFCLQPYKQLSLKNKGKDKLQPKFYGPYKVRERVGDTTYALDIPNKGRIHDVFHVSSLKKQIRQNITPQAEIPVLDEEGKFILEPIKVIETRTKNLRNRYIIEHLVQWKNLPIEEASWESNDFVKCHPILQTL